VWQEGEDGMISQDQFFHEQSLVRLGWTRGTYRKVVKSGTRGKTIARGEGVGVVAGGPTSSYHLRRKDQTSEEEQKDWGVSKAEFPGRPCGRVPIRKRADN